MIYNSVKELFTGICDAVRYRDGSTEQIAHQDIPSRIVNIEGSEPAVIEIDIPIDEVSFEYIPMENISEIEAESVAADVVMADIELLEGTATLGLSAFPTAEEIYNATHQIVSTICEILGMTEISYNVRTYGWSSDLALSGETDPIMRIGFSDNSSYKHQIFYCTTLYNKLDSFQSAVGYSSETISADYRSVNVYSSPLYMRYVKNKDGKIAFDFHKKSDTGGILSFQLADITRFHEDGVSSETNKCLLHTNMGDYALSVRNKIGYSNNGIYNYIPKLTDIFMKEDCETITCPLSVGHNMTLDECIRLYTNNNVADNGTLLEINGEIYIILYFISNAYPTLLMKL